MQRFSPTVPSLYTPVPICTKLLAPTYVWGQFLIGLDIDYLCGVIIRRMQVFLLTVPTLYKTDPTYKNCLKCKSGGIYVKLY